MNSRSSRRPSAFPNKETTISAPLDDFDSFVSGLQHTKETAKRKPATRPLPMPPASQAIILGQLPTLKGGGAMCKPQLQPQQQPHYKTSPPKQMQPPMQQQLPPRLGPRQQIQAKQQQLKPLQKSDDDVTMGDGDVEEPMQEKHQSAEVQPGLASAGRGDIAPISGDESHEEEVNHPDNEGDRQSRVVFKKVFITRRKSSVRLKARKIRQNRLLRKTLAPKNALMALHEVKGMAIGEFMITKNSDGGFTAVVHIGNKEYSGKGSSKVAAKNNACEQALRDYLLEKLSKHPRVPKRRHLSGGSVNGQSGTPMDEGGDSQNQAGVGAEANAAEDSNGPDNDNVKEEDDDVPMINLASFAIYKLFTEWEKEGYKVPEMHQQGSTVVPEAKKTPMRTELPPNWETMHPATLLCVMRPGLTYTDYGQIGDKPPNVLQSFGVIVDNKEFVGTGRNKKIAKRNASVMACNTLFATNFAKEEA